MPTEIGEFLQTRRARISPESRGLPAGDRRRVPGLRREELAALAGVSSDYYVRLEQGRAESVSDVILDAIAGALGLDDVEREHLHRLARPIRESGGDGERLRAGIRALVHGFADFPAFAIGRRQRILELNTSARAVLPPDAGGSSDSTLRDLFLLPASRRYYVDWEQVAHESVAYLRREFGRHQGDPLLARLVADLQASSTEFRELWDLHDVNAQTHGIRRLRPGGGEAITVEWETLTLPNEPDVYLIVYTPASEADADTIAARREELSARS